MKRCAIGWWLVLWGLTACVRPVQARPVAAMPAATPTVAAAWERVPVTPLPEQTLPVGRSYRNTPQWVQLQPRPEHPNGGCFADGCHQELLTQSGAFLHAPFAAGACRPCHDVAALAQPHQQPHVASEQDIAVCYTCHPPDTLGNSHPVDEGRTDPRTGGPLTCTSTCHDPHADPYPGLLRFPPGGGLCLQCHQEFQP